MKYSLFIK